MNPLIQKLAQKSQLMNHPADIERFAKAVAEYCALTVRCHAASADNSIVSAACESIASEITSAFSSN
jgi:hypothetical protein